MAYRYRVARAMGRQHFEEAVEEDKELLEELGARLLSVDSGMRAALEAELKLDGRVHPWNVVTFDEKTWNWIRPLLEELVSLRSGMKIAAN